MNEHLIRSVKSLLYNVKPKFSEKFKVYCILVNPKLI